MDTAAVQSFLSSVPTDWFIIGTFAVCAAIMALRQGAKPAFTLALALPATVYVLSFLPHAAFVSGFAGEVGTGLTQAILFVAAFGVLYFLIMRMHFSYGSDSARPFQAAILGLAAAAVLAVVWIASPALQAIWQFGPSIQAIFGGGYAFWWLIGSYLAMSFLGRR